MQIVSICLEGRRFFSAYRESWGPESRTLWLACSCGGLLAVAQSQEQDQGGVLRGEREPS